MKLSIIIQRFFNSDEFCHPIDFFWINKDIIKKCWKSWKSKKLLFVVELMLYFIFVVELMLYFIFATIAFLGYYILLPFRLLHEWCEEWCFR